MKRLKHSILILVIGMLLIPIQSHGAMLLAMLMRMYLEHLNATQIPVLCQGVCETDDGINISSIGNMSYEKGNSVYPDNMKLTVYLGDIDKENWMKNYLDLGFNEVLHPNNGDLILRNNNLVTNDEYIQVCAKKNGVIIVSSYYNGKYTDALYYKVDLSTSEYQERYSKFMNSQKSEETIRHENFVRDELRRRGCTMKDYYENENLREEIKVQFQQTDPSYEEYRKTMEELEKTSIDTKKERLKKEEQDYRELLKKEAQESAPKFGLG